MVPKLIMVEISLFPLIIFIPSTKSFLKDFKFICSGALWFFGMLIKISLMAESRKIMEFIINTTFIPNVPYKREVITGDSIFTIFINKELKKLASNNSSLYNILVINEEI